MKSFLGRNASTTKKTSTQSDPNLRKASSSNSNLDVKTTKVKRNKSNADLSAEEDVEHSAVSRAKSESQLNQLKVEPGEPSPLANSRKKNFSNGSLHTLDFEATREKEDKDAISQGSVDDGIGAELRRRTSSISYMIRSTATFRAAGKKKPNIKDSEGMSIQEENQRRNSKSETVQFTTEDVVHNLESGSTPDIQTDDVSSPKAENNGGYGGEENEEKIISKRISKLENAQDVSFSKSNRMKNHKRRHSKQTHHNMNGQNSGDGSSLYEKKIGRTKSFKNKIIKPFNATNKTQGFETSTTPSPQPTDDVTDISKKPSLTKSASQSSITKLASNTSLSKSTSQSSLSSKFSSHTSLSKLAKENNANHNNNTSKKEELERLRQELQHHNQIQDIQVQRIEELEEELKQSLDRYETFSQTSQLEKFTLTGKVSTLEKEIETMTTGFGNEKLKLVHKVNAIRETVAIEQALSGKKITGLTNKNKEFEANAVADKEHIAKLEEQIASITTEKENIEKLTHDGSSLRVILEDKISALNAELKNAEELKTSANMKSDEMKVQLKAKDELKEELMSEIKQLKSEKKILGEDLKTIQQDKESIVQESAKLRSQLEDQQQVTLTLEQKMATLEKQQVEREIAQKAHESEVAKNEAAFTASYEQDKIKLEKAMGDLETSRTIVADLQNQLLGSNKEKEDLELKFSSTQGANLTLQKQVQTLSEETSFLNDRVRLAKVSNIEKDEQLRSIQEKLEEFQRKRLTKDSYIESLENSLQMTKALLAEKEKNNENKSVENDDEKDQLRLQVVDFNQKISGLEQEIKDKSEEIERLGAETVSKVGDLSRQLEDKNGEVVTLEKKIREIETNNRSTEVEIGELKSELVALRLSQQELNATRTKLNEVQHALTQTQHLLEEKETELKVKKDKVTTLLDGMSSDRTELENKVKTLLADISVKDNALAALKTQIQTLENLEKTQGTTLMNHNEKISHLKMTNENLQQTAAELEATKNRIMDERKQMEMEKNKMEKDHLVVTEKKKELELSLETYQRKVEELKQTVQALEISKQSNMVEATSLSQQSEKLQKRLHEREEELNQLNAKTQQQELEIEAAQTSLTQSRVEANEQKQELEQIIENLQKENKELEVSKIELISEKKVMSTTNTTLSKELELAKLSAATALPPRSSSSPIISVPDELDQQTSPSNQQVGKYENDREKQATSSLSESPSGTISEKPCVSAIQELPGDNQMKIPDGKSPFLLAAAEDEADTNELEPHELLVKVTVMNSDAEPSAMKNILITDKNRLCSKTCSHDRKIHFGGDTLWKTCLEIGDLNEIKRQVTECGKDVNEMNDEGVRPLHSVCCEGHIDCVEYLLEQGAGINCVDQDNWTPLHCAACTNDLKLIKYLISQGGDFRVKSSENEIPADLCEAWNCTSYFKSLDSRMETDTEFVAIYDYDATQDDELTIKTKDVLEIDRENSESKNWLKATRKSDGKTGFVPITSLSVIT